MMMEWELVAENEKYRQSNSEVESEEVESDVEPDSDHEQTPDAGMLEAMRTRLEEQLRDELAKAVRYDVTEEVSKKVRLEVTEEVRALQAQCADLSRAKEEAALAHKKAVKLIRVELDQTLQSKAVQAKAKKSDMWVMRAELEELRKQVGQYQVAAASVGAELAETKERFCTVVGRLSESDALAAKLQGAYEQAQDEAAQEASTRRETETALEEQREGALQALEEQREEHARDVAALRVYFREQLRECEMKHKHKQEKTKQAMRAKLDKLLEIKDIECAAKVQSLEEEVDQLKPQADSLDLTFDEEAEESTSASTGSEDERTLQVDFVRWAVDDVLDEKQAAVAKYARRIRRADKRKPTSFEVTKVERQCFSAPDVVKSVRDVHSIAKSMHGRVLTRQGEPYALEVPESSDNLRYVVRARKTKRGERRNPIHRMKGYDQSEFSLDVQTVMNDHFQTVEYD